MSWRITVSPKSGLAALRPAAAPGTSPSQHCVRTGFDTTQSWELVGVMVVGVVSLRRPTFFRGDYLV